MTYFSSITFSIILIFTLVTLKSLISACETSDNDSLRLVHVIFRHGQRTNDHHTTYPKDPYINETYHPYGLGQLTDMGKEEVRLLGKTLQERYGNFLGKRYSTDTFKAVSTDLNRTRISLEIILDRLFSPVEENLNTSILYDRLTKNNQMMGFSLYRCPNYSKRLNNYLKSPDGARRLLQYSELLQYLSENTGREVNSIFHIYVVHTGLHLERKWGFQLPEWTNKVYPDYTKKGAIEQYLLSAATTELKQLSGGFLLKEIIQNIQLKINETLTPRDRKMFIYSGHEYNIAHLLIAMEIFYPHIPPPAAYITIELHKVCGDHGIKIFYQDYSEAEPKSLLVPGCDYVCPFNKFVEILRMNLPTKNNACYEEEDHSLAA